MNNDGQYCETLEVLMNFNFLEKTYRVMKNWKFLTGDIITYQPYLFPAFI